MKTDKETHATWNKLAEVYAEKFMDQTLYLESIVAFCNLLPSSPRILELGCGPGNVTRILFDQCENPSILATDYAPSMVALTQKNNPAAKTQVLDCRKMNQLPNAYHGILSGFTLPYLTTQEASDLIADCSKKLLPNGKLYLSYVPGNPADSGYITNGSGDRVLFNYHTAESLQAQMHTNKLNLETTFTVLFPRGEDTEEHHILIATKMP